MKKITFIYILLLLCNDLLFSQLKINEIMTNNVSAVWDDAYNFSMWVELYNPTSASVNQSLYYFTDNPALPRKWQLPALYLSAGSFNTLWFEKPLVSNHANFKLDPEGGSLYLFNAAGTLIDYVTYPSQYRNVSYGRKTDGAEEWVFFTDFSKSASNNGRTYASKRCGNPEFAVKGGLFSNGLNVKFVTPLPGDTIYYNLNAAEPTRTNSIRYTPGASISVTSTTIIRARTFGAGKIPGRVVTSTYLIGQRDFNLPVVSIVTPQLYLTDNMVGIYVAGINGITGNGSNTPVNWNQDWDRPANFELIDTTNTVRINQEIDIQIAGAWSRTMNGQKSLHLQPKNKFEKNKLDYDIFKASKPGHPYKDIMLRNAGNDFYYSMMRDGFMQSLIINRMDLDYMAYEPAVLFINGEYYGIQNLRERSNSDFLYSNYGYQDEEVTIIDQYEIAANADYIQMMDYINKNDINTPEVYAQLCNLMDVDSYINYMLTEIYTGNYDWPHNNIKMWKKTTGGKWRWLLFDLDFGYNLYETNLYTFNALTYALGENSSKSTQAWATELFKRLIINDTFRNKFIDRACIHLSSTFETNRVNKIMDSIAAKIYNEILYHKTRWPGSARTLVNDISNMKTFSANRPANMLSHISTRFLSGAATQNITLTSNNNQANYTFNDEIITDANIQLKSFTGRKISLKANTLPGYNFKYWELLSAVIQENILPFGSTWKYWDGNAIPAENWNTTAYNDGSWKSGAAQLGYGNKGEVTLIGYGGNANAKYPTAYFRKTIYIDDVNKLSNIIATVFADDGAAVYVNGTEAGRFNLGSGTLTFNTLTTTYNNGEYASFPIPLNLLKTGDNIIAVEVHQTAVNSSDLIFNLQISCEKTVSNVVETNPVYTTTLNTGINIKAVYEENNAVDPLTLATIKINEIVSSNNQDADEKGEKDDYIELYNYGNKAVNLAGWYLSDDHTNLRLSQITNTDSAATLIQPGGFLVIWCDDTPTQGALHTGFKLSKEGEFIALSANDKFGFTQVVDSVSFPLLEQNTSFARVPDGSINWNIQASSINKTNILTAVSEENINLIKIYPTTTHDKIYIENGMNSTINLTDLSGRILNTTELSSNRESIDLSDLQSGVYLISTGKKSFRIIKL